MLQRLRDKTSGWIATIVLGLLIIPFAFVGVTDYLGGGNASRLVRVQAPPSWWASAPSWWPASLLWKHVDIGAEEFRTRFEQARQQQHEAEGDAFDSRAFETRENKLKVLDQLIDEKVVQLASDQAGIAVGDAAVRDYIAAIPAFQVDGKFDGDRYRMVLMSQAPQRTPEQFEQLVRDSLRLEVIPAGIGESAFIGKHEMDRLVGLIGQTRDVQIAQLPEPAADAAAVTDAQIKQWYDGHGKAFRKPESVSIEYVDLDASKLPAPAAPSENELRKRYDADKTKFVQPEQRLASHILIQVDAKADEATRKAAEAKAARLAEEARKPGADFAALAKANSDDPGSKLAGGDLGWVEKGAMVKPFEDALFSMKAGEIRGPVKTDFGYHVIDLREVKPGQATPFEQVRAQLAAEIGKEAADRAFNDLSGKLMDEVYKNPTELASAAKQAGLPVQVLGPFNKAMPVGIAATPAVMRAAFSDALVQDGTVSDPIQIAPGHSVVLRVTKHEPEQVLPLAQVRDQVIAAIRADRQAKAAEKAADALIARVQKGETLQGLAVAEKLQVTPMPGLPRGAPVPTPAANQAIFAVPAPAAGKTVAGKFEIAPGHYAVFEVTAVKPGDVAALPAAQRGTLQKQIEMAQGNAAVKDYVSALRRSFKVSIDEKQL